jgi:hypothetical protein
MLLFFIEEKNGNFDSNYIQQFRQMIIKVVLNKTAHFSPKIVIKMLTPGFQLTKEA